MISIKDIYKIEIIKLIKRKDIWVMMTMIGIPMFYSIGIYTNSSVITYNGDGKEYALKFVIHMFQFVYMVYIFFFLISLSTAKSLAGEIENKSILLYTQRINNRKQIYIHKGLSLISVFSLICILFFITSLAMFYLFAVKRTDIISSTFFKREELFMLICSFLIIYLLYVFMINLSLMLSSFLKQNSVLIITSIVYIVFAYLQNFPYVKYISPSYYVLQISKIEFFNTQGIINLIVPCIILHAVYFIILNMIGIKKFKERDLY
ncbi:ABC transporter permease (plasmid) [Paraclostridium ghonii]|uniref:ABC transporter permease n=1 Tax=Paraclostridium ghonii TaxID=29358 RepID=UPI00202CD8ED|nr:ABC transporter permease [Paeniclostridium ghonii]MCM0165525.1 ABC transporter permease [Paeniclostridium ghonii]